MHIKFIIFLFFLHSGIILSNGNFTYLDNQKTSDIVKLKKFIKSCAENNFLLTATPQKDSLFNRALEIANNSGNEIQRITILNLLSTYKRNNGQFKKSKEISLEILNSAINLNLKYIVVQIYQRLSFIARREGNFEKSEKYSKLLLDFAVKSDDPHVFIEACVSQSAINQRLKRFDKALDYLFKARNIAEKKSINNSLANIYTQIGRIYLSIHDFNSALNMRLKALHFSEISGDSLAIITAKHRLGDVYRILGNYDKAMPLLFEALKFREHNTRKDRYAQVEQSIAKVYFDKGVLDSAKQFFKNALKNFKLMKHFLMVADANVFLGKIYFKQNKLDSAKTFYQTALKNINNKTRYEMYSEAYLGLSKIAEREKQFKEAFHYLELHKAADDSLKFDIRNRRVAFTEAEYKYKLEKEVREKNFNTQLQLKESEISFKNYLVLGSIIFSVSISFLLLLLYRASKKQKKSLQIISSRNTDIESKNKSLEELNKIKNNYFTILAHDLRSPFGTILQLSEITNKFSKENKISELSNVTNLLESASKKFNELLESTLEWGRLQMNGIKVFREELNLYDEITNTCELINFTAKAKEITITNSIETDIKVFSDKDILQNILNNLIINAIKYSKRKSQIKIFGANRDNNFIKIAIQDEGIGISISILKEIFSGTIAKSTGTEGETGIGFGLLNSKKMIELNGGTISIESEEGIGTIVYLTLRLSNQN